MVFILWYPIFKWVALTRIKWHGIDYGNLVDTTTTPPLKFNLNTASISNLFTVNNYQACDGGSLPAARASTIGWNQVWRKTRWTVISHPLFPFLQEFPYRQPMPPILPDRSMTAVRLPESTGDNKYTKQMVPGYTGEIRDNQVKAQPPFEVRLADWPWTSLGVCANLLRGRCSCISYNFKV